LPFYNIYDIVIRLYWVL